MNDIKILIIIIIFKNDIRRIKNYAGLFLIKEKKRERDERKRFFFNINSDI